MENKRENGRNILQEIIGDDFMKLRDSRWSPFNEPLAKTIEENCFGDVWAREGLDRKTRSLIVIAVFIALNRSEELKNHVRGAINNGASVLEIQEVLYQMTIYCGQPAAASAFHVAEAVLKEMGQLP